MYNPPRFKSENWQEAFEWMEQRPFATLVTVKDSLPWVTHLPLTPEWRASELYLVGHMARANPQSQGLNGVKATAIFHGPQAYITPTWYAENDVPTWNYLAIHARGTIETLEGREALEDCLRKLTTHAEKYWPSGWEFWIPPDLQGEAFQKSILGFQMKVDELNFKKKLGQHRSREDFEGVIQGLATRPDEEAKALRAEMIKIRK